MLLLQKEGQQVVDLRVGSKLLVAAVPCWCATASSLLLLLDGVAGGDGQQATACCWLLPMGSKLLLAAELLPMGSKLLLAAELAAGDAFSGCSRVPDWRENSREMEGDVPAWK